MSKLNPRQHDAVRYTDGPLLVLAGAGSGKTAVITHKIAHLIRECGVDRTRINAVTFTNKAAREMKSRVNSMLSAKEAKGLNISTFHTLGLNILRKDGEQLGYKKGLSIYDADDGLNLVRELQRDSAARGSDAQQFLWQISRWKNALLNPQQALATCASDAFKTQAALVYDAYQRHLKACNAVDFDDLVLQPVRLFQEHPEILDAWQNRIRYLLVDEYQDTNACQYALVKLLVGPRAAFTVVGDDDQSIYAWRGAQPENLELLQKDFTDLKVIKLEQNYRSSGRILKAANALIGCNPHVFEKRLWSELGYGDPIRVLVAQDEEQEAERVVSQILHHKFSQRTEFRDYAILYRGNHQARLFERALREQRIPYYLSGGTSFFERSEIRDVMAYLRLIANTDDNNAFLRIVNTPRREIGTTTLEKLASYANQRQISLVDASFELGLEQHLNDRQTTALRRFTHWVIAMHERAQQEDALDLIRAMLDEIRYDQWLLDNCDSEQIAEKRYENILELVAWLQRLSAQDEEKQYTDLITRISLLGMLDNDEADSSRDQVSLMTLHAAKGLEFPHVFMVGMEEGLLPHRSSLEADSESADQNAAIEEERRLAYVGITRARTTLTFSLTQQRKRYGETIVCEPSRFLNELPSDDIQWSGAAHPSNPEDKIARADAHLANLRGLLG